jgi:hypothetical protein
MFSSLLVQWLGLYYEHCKHNVLIYFVYLTIMSESSVIRVNTELDRVCKEVYVTRHLQVGTVRKTTENFSQNNRFPGRDLNPVLSEYGGMLTTRP